MGVARLFLFADWPEKYFSGQSEGGISNASGTRSERVSPQGLSRSCCKLSPMKILLSRLAAPGSPRMPVGLIAQLVRALHRYRRGQGSNPGKPDFFRLSFRNCISCVNNREDLLYIYFLIFLVEVEVL